jgi:hypothetical protein
MERVFDSRCGVIGRALEQKKPQAFVRKNNNYQLFVQELKQNWQYTEDDAKKLRHDRCSSFAVPIFGVDSQHVVGVVYFDSDDKKFFNDTVQNLAIHGCRGIGKHIAAHYQKVSNG